MGFSKENGGFFSLLLVLVIFFLNHVDSKPVSNVTSPYLSPSLFFANYQKMIHNFNILVYQPHHDQTILPTTSSSVESLFHTALLNSSFLTTDGNQAHLFYLFFPDSYSSTRSISRLIRDVRTQFPFWNRTLGADHFYLLPGGLSYESDRNLVELKKNSVQISCLPSTQGKFIPHKDVTLPPLINPPSIQNLQVPTNSIVRFLGYFNGNGKEAQIPDFGLSILDELRDDPDFLIESQQSDLHLEKLSSSRFCLFFYGGDVSGMVDALRYGCVPVVITDRPILDLPFMDVLRWSEIAMFVGTGRGGVKVKEMKRSMESTCCSSNERAKYKRMRELGKTASKHFVWNSSPQMYDAFHTVLYQLWSRRHTIRYARRDEIV